MGLKPRDCSTCKFQYSAISGDICIHSKSTYKQEISINGIIHHKIYQHSCAHMVMHNCGPTYSFYLRKE